MNPWKVGDAVAVNVGGRTGNEWRTGEVVAIRPDGKLAILLPRAKGDRRRVVRPQAFVRRPE